MNDQTTQDALEYGQHVRGGDWRLGLLVARNVEKGKGESPGTNQHTKRSVGIPKDLDGKVSANAFAKKSKTGIERVLNHLEMWEKAAEAGLVPAASTLNPGDGDKIRLPDAELAKDYYTSVSGGYNGGKDRTPTLDSVLDTADKLNAEDRAKVANVLVSKPEVVEQIIQSGEMALDPYLDLATEAFKMSKGENERKTKTRNPSVAALDARDEIAQATRHLRNAQYEVVQWRVEKKHDMFMLLEGALNEAKAIIEAIEEIIDSEREPA